MNLEQAVALTNMRKQTKAMLLAGDTTKTAKEIAEMVFDLSAAVGEPYLNAAPKVWAERWLGSKRFTLVDIDPRQVAVPFVNRISRAKVLATMQASSDSLPPIVVDVNKCGIGKTSTGYVPQTIVVDGKTRHRAQMLCGRERISAWVGDRALAILRARAVTKHKYPEDPDADARPLSKIEVAAAWGGMHVPPTGGTATSVARQDTGDGGARPTGSTHLPTRTLRSTGGGAGAGAGASSGGASAGGGPGGAVSGLNPLRKGFNAEVDPSDRGQMLDPSDKDQFSHGAPKSGDPSKQSPGGGGGERTRPSTGASHSEMSKKMLAGPVRVKKIVTDKKKKKMQAVAPPGREAQVLKLKEKFGEDSATPYKIAWSQKNKGKS